MKKLNFKPVVFASAMVLGSGSAMAAESVKIGAPAWTGAQAIAHLIQEIVVTRIGGSAESVSYTHLTLPTILLV